MDITLARTFLAICHAGSFMGAATHLNVTQTTVTARVRSLEAQLGHRLFERGRHGAMLTAHGTRFLPYATSLVQLWKRAQQDIHSADSGRHVLSLGGELSLWNPLLLDWLIWMRQHRHTLLVHTRTDLPVALLDQVERGVLDMAVTYAPGLRPHLQAEHLMDEELVMVTTDPAGTPPSREDYVHIDWGGEFRRQHASIFPDLRQASVFVGLGPLALHYILRVGGAGYFRRRVVAPYLSQGQLFPVRNAPPIAYPAYAVFSNNADPQRIGIALDGLRTVASSLGGHWPV